MLRIDFFLNHFAGDKITMIERICASITETMYEAGIIDLKTKNIYIYCLDQLLSQVIFVVIILLFGIIRSEPVVSLIYLICTMTLRTFGGGAHAPSKKLCILFSYGISIITIILSPLLYKFISIMPSTLIYIICSLIIWYLSPISHKNKPLSDSKKIRLHHKCGISFIFITVFVLLCLITNHKKYLVTITLSVIIVCISSIIGYIQNIREQAHDSKDRYM